MRVWAGCVWLNEVSSGVFFEPDNEPMHSIKCGLTAVSISRILLYGLNFHCRLCLGIVSILLCVGIVTKCCTWVIL